MNLNKKGKEILESAERGEWKSIPNFKREAKRCQEYAKATFRKDKRVSIRMSGKDLVNTQKRALQEGLPDNGTEFGIMKIFAIIVII